MKNKKNKYRPGLLIAAAVLLAAILCSCSAQGENLIEKPTEDPIPGNSYDPDAFYTEKGFLRYRDQKHKIGVDVSAYQGVIDWKAVAEAGVEFAIIRAGYRGSTVGDLYEDEQFAYNLTEARKAGIKVGAYFFSQALTPEEAKEEAVYACWLLKNEPLDLPVYFDWEFNDGRIPSVWEIPLTDCAEAFCREVEEQGFKAGVYFNQNYGYYHLNLKELQKYHLWLAEYGEEPSFRYHFDCLQYSDSGTVPGIEVPVDLDILFIEEEKKSPAEPDSSFISEITCSVLH